MTHRATSTTPSAAIASSDAELIAAIRRGDAIAVMNCYFPDAVLLPAGHRSVVGRDAIQAYWWAGLEAGLRELELHPEARHVCGELAVEAGRLTMQMTAAPSQRRTGRYVALFRRDAHGWWGRAAELVAIDGLETPA